MKKERDLDEYLQECIRIEPEALQEEFVRMPADFAFWNEQYKTALESFLRAKANLEQVEAKTYLVACNKLNPATAKVFTVDGIKALVETEDTVMMAREALIIAEVEMTKLKGILEAIRTKRDMLIQLGAQIRTEMQNDPVVRKQASDARMMRER
jgi:hypothetical protein